MKMKQTQNRKNGKFQRPKLFKNKRKLRKETEEREIDKIKKACESIEPDHVISFNDLPLSRSTIDGLLKNQYFTPTEIQRESLCLSLRGIDVLGAAKTGSGKSLAFIIPILEVLYMKRWMAADGLGALVITPTRELAYQIFETLRKVGCFHNFSAGLIIGGKDLHFEKQRMGSCNIVICTPGRLLQHMDENPVFNCDNLQILVLDEADRCLSMGFEKTMNAIIENLPATRQTLLFSATQTKSVRDLARLSLKDPMYVSVHEHASHSTPEDLKQSYVVCELHEKVDILWSFIKNHLKKKTLVFFSTCKQVKYHFEMFSHMRPGVSLLALYGSLHQLRRMAIYDDFSKKSNAVLFATDIAARGLDFPNVDWVLQVDCPEDADTYIHRVGRTARYHKGGESLLVMLPSEEEGMLAELKKKRIPLTKIKVNPKKLRSPLKKMESLLVQNTELKDTAQRAFVSYLKAVHLMKNKNIFNIHALDVAAYAKSLGLVTTPRIRFLKRQQKMNQESVEISHDDRAANISSTEVVINKEDPSFVTESEDSADEYSEKVAEEKNELNAFGGDTDSDDDGNDLLILKRKDHDLDGPLLEIKDDDKRKAKKKVKTKAAIARKILKKKIVANKKVIFTEDGEVVVDPMREKVSDIAREYESENVGGIDIEKAKLVLRQEDKIDKQLFREKVKAKHREKKLALKKGRTNDEEDNKIAEEKEEGIDEEGAISEEREEEDEDVDVDDDSEEESGSEPDLSWLPDPDAVYGQSNNSKSEEESDEEVGSESDHSDIIERTPQTSKRFIDEELGPSTHRKKRRVGEQNAVSDLTVDEELALHFLKK